MDEMIWKLWRAEDFSVRWVRWGRVWIVVVEIWISIVRRGKVEGLVRDLGWFWMGKRGCTGLQIEYSMIYRASQEPKIIRPKNRSSCTIRPECLVHKNGHDYLPINLHLSIKALFHSIIEHFLWFQDKKNRKKGQTKKRETQLACVTIFVSIHHSTPKPPI